MCFSGVHHRLHASPALLSSTFGHCAALFQAPSGTSRCTRFQASAIPGAPSAFEPVLCRRDSRQLCPLLFALYRVQGLLLVSLCSGRTFALPFTLGSADCPFKSNVVRRNCLPARLQNTVLHAGNLPLCMAIQRQRSAILAAKPLLNICMRPTRGRLQIPACNSMFHVKQRRTRAHRQHFCKA